MRSGAAGALRVLLAAVPGLGLRAGDLGLWGVRQGRAGRADRPPWRVPSARERLGTAGRLHGAPAAGWSGRAGVCPGAWVRGYGL